MNPENFLWYQLRLFLRPQIQIIHLTLRNTEVDEIIMIFTFLKVLKDLTIRFSESLVNLQKLLQLCCSFIEGLTPTNMKSV
jgi:hypothetical protein